MGEFLLWSRRVHVSSDCYDDPLAIEPAAGNPEYQRLVQLQADEFARNKPYHSLELNDGQVIPGLISISDLRTRIDAYGLPEDLTGKRVLDIGAASGWNSFECERRGADVVAIDYVEYEELTAVKRLRESKLEYVVMDMDELTPERFGYFDYVLFFGVLYHLRHPLLGLERVCAVTRGTALIESFVTEESGCNLEFYETDQLGGQIDNWFGPSVECLKAMTRSAGFAQVDFLYAHLRRCGLIARRHWPKFEGSAEAPFLCSAVNNRHHDVLFQQGKDEYLVLSFLSDRVLTKDDVFVELDGFGVPSIFLVKHEAGYWQVNCKVPPGVAAGEHEARVGIRGARYSDPVRIRMLPAGADRRFGEVAFRTEAIAVAAPEITLCENTMDHSRTFHGYRNEKLIVQFTHEEQALHLSRVQLTVDGNGYRLLSVERPKPGIWQMNAKLKGLERGTHELRIRTANSEFSPPVTVDYEPNAV